jgi:protein-tyrosine phosphatase
LRTRLTAFLNAGFDTFFDLTREGELPAYLPDLLEEARTYGRQVRYRRFPIGDFGLPTPAQMTDILDALDAALAEGRRVYLHCWGGIGRTGTTVGCYLVRHGLGGQQALDRLMELYRTAEQSLVHPRSPETDAQAEFVRNWKG